MYRTQTLRTSNVAMKKALLFHQWVPSVLQISAMNTKMEHIPSWDASKCWIFGFILFIPFMCDINRYECSSNGDGQRVAYTDSDCTTEASTEYYGITENAYFNHTFRLFLIYHLQIECLAIWTLWHTVYVLIWQMRILAEYIVNRYLSDHGLLCWGIALFKPFYILCTFEMLNCKP